MQPVENDKKYLLKSLNKALKVLDIIIVREELSLTEICGITGLDKTSAFKILYTLERRGFVTKTPDTRYRIGEKITNYGGLRSERRNIVDVAAVHLRALSSVTGQTCTMAILNANGRTMNIFVELGKASDHIPARVGLELDAYSVPMGKVLLAYSPDQTVRTILQNAPLRAYTPTTIASPAQLYQVLEDVREKGHCMDRDERYTGRGSLAAPIFDHSGQCVAAIGVLCSTERYLEKKDFFLQELLKVANLISREMGFPAET